MKFLFFILMLSSTLSAAPREYKAEFPLGPIESLTPGSLCDRPDEYRYPERIPYCNRSVDGNLKDDIFREYREEGFRLNPKNRSQYKIDHLIPLCAGGSNRETNLWPQHKTVYVKTDPLEPLGCEKLKNGKIKQKDLVKLILEAKKNLSLVPKTLKYLQNL